MNIIIAPVLYFTYRRLFFCKTRVVIGRHIVRRTDYGRWAERSSRSRLQGVAAVAQNTGIALVQLAYRDGFLAHFS